MDEDTIAALSTPPGRGSVAVIRLSGPKTRIILQQIIENLPSQLQPLTYYHGFVSDRQRRLDECLVVFFAAPHSYTAEDVAEVSIHASPFLVDEVLELIFLKGARQALPGEFTYRAFRNGRIDLMQAEAVNELIQANSKYYARMAFGSLEGRLSALVTRIRQSLTRLAVEIETSIEFAEDQVLETIIPGQGLGELIESLHQVLQHSRFADVLNRGVRVVIAGKVNVGKSSLFNLLLQEERSIISHLPGTTRDYIKERLHLKGFPFEVTDVAGMGNGESDEVEKEGVRRSWERLANCDAVIYLLDASRQLESSDHQIYEQIKDKPKIILANKMDVALNGMVETFGRAFGPETVHPVSVRNHENIQVVISFLEGLIPQLNSRELELAVNHRQKLLLSSLLEKALDIKQRLAAKTAIPELAAEEIRQALGLIGELTGEITPDDIIQEIFSTFCIGK